MKVFIIMAVCLIIAGCDNATAMKSYPDEKTIDLEQADIDTMIAEADVVVANDNVIPDTVQPEQDGTKPEADVLSNEGEHPDEDTEKANWTEWSGLKWSDVYKKNLDLQQAQDYCMGIDGRLPTINEGRRLIKECPHTMTGGDCNITDANHSIYDQDYVAVYCRCGDGINYSYLGDAGYNIWMYVAGDKKGWTLDFMNAGLQEGISAYVRCVKPL